MCLRKAEVEQAAFNPQNIVEGIGFSPDKMLQGRLPGVAVMNMSSTPGAAPKIRIRGSSSITGNREPVWVVDGIILEENYEPGGYNRGADLYSRGVVVEVPAYRNAVPRSDDVHVPVDDGNDRYG